MGSREGGGWSVSLVDALYATRGCGTLGRRGGSSRRREGGAGGKNSQCAGPLNADCSRARTYRVRLMQVRRIMAEHISDEKGVLCMHPFDPTVHLRTSSFELVKSFSGVVTRGGDVRCARLHHGTILVYSLQLIVGWV